MILLKIYLTLILITIYAFLIAVGKDKEKEEQFEDFYELMRIIFFVGFLLTFILSIVCIYVLIK